MLTHTHAVCHVSRNIRNMFTPKIRQGTCKADLRMREVHIDRNLRSVVVGTSTADTAKQRRKMMHFKCNLTNTLLLVSQLITKVAYERR